MSRRHLLSSGDSCCSQIIQGCAERATITHTTASSERIFFQTIFQCRLQCLCNHNHYELLPWPSAAMLVTCQHHCQCWSSCAGCAAKSTITIIMDGASQITDELVSWLQLCPVASASASPVTAPALALCVLGGKGLIHSDKRMPPQPDDTFSALPRWRCCQPLPPQPSAAGQLPIQQAPAVNRIFNS